MYSITDRSTQKDWGQQQEHVCTSLSSTQSFSPSSCEPCTNYFLAYNLSTHTRRKSWTVQILTCIKEENESHVVTRRAGRAVLGKHTPSPCIATSRSHKLTLHQSSGGSFPPTSRKISSRLRRWKKNPSLVCIKRARRREGRTTTSASQKHQHRFQTQAPFGHEFAFLRLGSE